MKTFSVVGATLDRGRNAERSPIVASLVAGTDAIFVSRQSRRQNRTAANARKRCWRSPESTSTCILWRGGGSSRCRSLLCPSSLRLLSLSALLLSVRQRRPVFRGAAGGSMST